MEMDMIREAPAHGNLIAERIERRIGRRKSSAIIIPAYQDPGMLRKHLSLLCHQTTYDFDVIAVHGSEERIESADPKLSILHVRLKRNLGCAGAFYVGQRIALEEGYRKIILADDDCLPESEDLVEALAKKLDTEYVASPMIRLRPSDKLCRGVIHHYGAMRREALLSAGLSYLPFFLSGEDFDLMRRFAKAGMAIAPVDAVASHPLWPPIFLWDMRKLHAYSRNNIIQSLIGGDIMRGAISMSIHLQTGVALVILGKNDQSRMYLRSAWEASDCRLGQVLGQDRPLRPIAEIDGNHGAQENGMTVRSRDPSRDMESDAFLLFGRRSPVFEVICRLRAALTEHGGAVGSLNKDILFDGFGNISDIPHILLARGSSIRFESGVYSITRDRDPFSIAFGAAAFLAAAPISIALGSALALRGISIAMIRGIRSDGYGIPRK